MAYLDPKARCEDLSCNRVIPEGASVGEVNARFWAITPDSSKGKGIGVSASAAPATGVFYTDPFGMGLVDASDATATRQYVQPGLELLLIEGSRHWTRDPWRYSYVTVTPRAMSSNFNLEGGLQPATQGSP